MEALIQQLRLMQSNAFIYYTEAHGYHWNVEGILFEQFHEMFSDIYTDVWESVDAYAEWIRILGGYAAFDVPTILATSNVKYDQGIVNSPIEMLMSLNASNDQVIADLKDGFIMANNANEQGLADFIASRITAHEKTRWIFRASLKTITVG